MFNKIKSYYKDGLWDIIRVKNVVGKVITAEDYLKITGFVYPNMPS